MELKTPLGILRWFLILGLLSWGAILGLAQTKSAQPTKPAAQPPATAPVQRWQGGQRTITDAAGRAHVLGRPSTVAGTLEPSSGQRVGKICGGTSSAQDGASQVAGKS
jgi:hypothetical protein